MTNDMILHPDRLTPKGTVFEGTFRPGDLENLAAELASPDGELHYRIVARLDSARRRVVSVPAHAHPLKTRGSKASFEGGNHGRRLGD